MNKKLIGVASVAVLVIAIIGAYQFPKVRESVRDVVRLGAISGPTVLDPLELEGGVKYGSNTATTTRVSGTLALDHFRNADVLVVTPTGAAAAKTLTFFASSTAPHWLPVAGDSQRTCVYNATTTEATTLIFAEGTGIDLEIATSTGNSSAFDRTLGANDFACFTFIRKPATATTFDIGALFLEFSDGN